MLKGMAGLTYFDASGTAVTNAAVDVLGGLAKLSDVKLRGSKVDEAGGKKLLESLPMAKVDLLTK